MTTDRARHLRLMASSLDPLPPPLKTTILPPTLTTTAWAAIVVVVGAALAVLAGCAGPSDDRGNLPPAPVVAARSIHASWCPECSDLPSLGVKPRVARRGQP
jgi:hypothetical protein